MAMSFSAISDEDILVEETWNACNFKASGSINAGEAVEMQAERVGTGVPYVKTASQDHGDYKASSNAFIGVAAYTVSNEDDIGIYTTGKVTVRASGAITAGDKVKAVSKGYFQTQHTAASGTASGDYYQGVALETFTSDEAGVILLK